MDISISALIPAGAFLGFMVLIALVARQSLQRRVNQLFVWYAFALAAWGLGSFMMHANFPSTLFWNNFLIIPLVFGSIAYFHFVQVFLRRPAPILWLLLGYGMATLFIIPVALGYAVEYAYIADGVYYHKLGIATYIIAPFGYSFVLAGAFQLFREYKKTKDPFVRNRLAYPMVGVMIALALVGTNFIGGLGRYPIDQAGNLINASLLSYAVLRYRLIDVGIALRRGFLYSVLTVFIIAIFLCTALLLQTAFHAAVGAAFWISAVVMALIIAAVFQPVHRFTQRWIDRLFYRESYDYRQTLRTASQKLGAMLNLEELAGWLVNNLMVTMQPSKVGLFLLDRETQSYVPRMLRGYENHAVSNIQLRSDNPVVKRLATGSSCLTAEEIERLPQLRSLWKSERAQLKQLEAAVAVPLKAKDALIGMLVLGPKRSEESYSFDDLELLLTVANQAAVAVENARLYEESQLRAEKLRESEEKYRDLVERMEDGYIVLRGDRILFANKRCAEEMGIPVEEIVGQPFLKFLSPESLGLAMKTHERSMAGETLTGEKHEFVILREDGTRIPVEVSFRDIVYEGKPAVSHILRDITERKRAEEEILERSKRLEVISELSRIIGSSLDIREVYQAFTDEIKKIVDFDRASIALVEGDKLRFFAVSSEVETELDRGVTIPLEDSITAWVMENKRTNIETDFAREMQFPSINGIHLRSGLRSAIRVPLFSKGEVFGTFNLTSRHPNAYGEREREILEQVAGQLAVAIENSGLFIQIKEHEEELGKAYEELKTAQDYMVQSERLRALGEMAGGVAHDFNNILAVILGRAQLALEDAKESRLRKSLQVIEQTALDAAKTVRRLQDFTRVRADREFELVNLNQVVRSALQMVEPRRAERREKDDVEIEISADLDRVAWVQGDTAELREALMNIIFNAMDAMPEGGKITVKSEQEDSWVVLSISDTGIGMPEEVKGRIFDPFFTTKSPEGIGLGLSVTYGIVTRHGGSIVVESSLGQGSTFYIRLPVASGSRKRARPANDVISPTRELRILLVDDDPQVSEVLELMLGQLGNQVTVATTGKEAVGAFEKGDYELVITDLGMADMSGRDVAKAVKEMKPATPVILITGWGVQLDSAEMQKIGVDGVIAKPFSKDVLSAQIAELLASERYWAES